MAVVDIVVVVKARLVVWSWPFVAELHARGMAVVKGAVYSAQFYACVSYSAM